MKEYGLIALFLVVSVGFAAFMLLLPLLLRKLKISPYKPSAVKSSTVECGLETTGRSWVRFNPRYYFFAMVAVALDVMMVIILPWAVDVRWMGWSFFLGGVVFCAILMVAYIYAWRKGALKWE